jgi:hypothetical protein
MILSLSFVVLSSIALADGGSGQGPGQSSGQGQGSGSGHDSGKPDRLTRWQRLVDRAKQIDKDRAGNVYSLDFEFPLINRINQGDSLGASQGQIATLSQSESFSAAHSGLMITDGGGDTMFVKNRAIGLGTGKQTAATMQVFNDCLAKAKGSARGQGTLSITVSGVPQTSVFKTDYSILMSLGVDAILAQLDNKGVDEAEFDLHQFLRDMDCDYQALSGISLNLDVMTSVTCQLTAAPSAGSNNGGSTNSGNRH